MKNIIITDMTVCDFNEIKDNLIEQFDDFWKPEILKTELTLKNRKYIVAKENNEIIGFAGIMLNYEETEIMNIVVRKDKRKNGIGSLILEKIIEITKNNNYEKIFLEVNEKNCQAIELYEKFGFNRIRT